MYACGAHICGVSTVTNERKSERLVARVSRHDKALLERAADIEGRSLATFVVAHAVADAERLVNGHETTRLNAEESRRFVEALLAPPRPPTAALKRAMARYRRNVISS